MQPSFFQSGGGGAVYDNGTWRLYTVSSSPVMTNNIRSVLAVGEAVWWGHGGMNTFSVHSPNWLRFNNVPCWRNTASDLPRSHAHLDRRHVEDRLHQWRRVHLDQHSGQHQRYVSSFARDGNSDLWIGTSGNGVYNYSGGQLHTLHHHERPAQQRRESLCSAIISAASGRAPTAGWRCAPRPVTG